MNIFRREKASPGPTSTVPPRPSKEDLDNRVQHSRDEAAGEVTRELDPTAKRTGLMGVLDKVNPFKSTSQGPVGGAASSESPEPGAASSQSVGVLSGAVREVNPFKSSSQENQLTCTEDSDSADDGAIQRQTFRIRRILPTNFFGFPAKDSSSDTGAPAQFQEVEPLQTAEGTVLDPLDDEEGLVGWWRTVDGWDDWNEGQQSDAPEELVEQAADRVFMAARLFVGFFNQRGASLQQRILELSSVADAADVFHRKAVTASVGGGVASVAGSVATITGLVLAPFTAGASLIVTAVGIGVATAGGVASASANITDAVHSKTERKKVEKIIQDYEDQMKDIRECLEFLQEGMELLEEWNFEEYAENISKKHLNQNVRHVMKEGGRAGKALVVNTESLINTVQVLSAAGGAAKAAQVMSVTTGVMSGLFLALDLFFLAKDAKELKEGAKTEFAAKIREVCQDLQDGLLELDRIKEQLQRTIDGIEVVEEEEEEEEAAAMLKSDLKKLAEFE